MDWIRPYNIAAGDEKEDKDEEGEEDLTQLARVGTMNSMG